MSDVDEVRSELFKGEGAFVDKLRDGDKNDPALHDEAVVRLNALFRYASVDGRKRFLDEMKIPGAWREARRAYEICLKGGGSEEECQEAQAKVKTFRPIFEAWPAANTVQMWWSAPLTHLIGTYDTNNLPAGEFKGWRQELREADPVIADLVDAGEAVADITDDITETVGGAFEPEPEDEGISWWSIGAGVAASAIVGAVVYRIAKG
jgi:hypothetical protein